MLAVISNIGSLLQPVLVLTCPNKCSSQTRVINTLDGAMDDMSVLDLMTSSINIAPK